MKRRRKRRGLVVNLVNGLLMSIAAVVRHLAVTVLVCFLLFTAIGKVQGSVNITFNPVKAEEEGKKIMDYIQNGVKFAKAVRGVL